MSTTIEREVVSVDPVEIVKNEIEQSRIEHRPISRQLLADMIATRFSMKKDRAWAIVDQYCTEHEAGVPGYLRQEFNMHWPKVIGVLIAAAGIGVGIFGLQAHHTWMYLTGATVLLGFGALLFVHSLESFQKFQRERRDQLLR